MQRTQAARGAEKGDTSNALRDLLAQLKSYHATHAHADDVQLPSLGPLYFGRLQELKHVLRHCGGAKVAHTMSFYRFHRNLLSKEATHE